MTRIQEENDKIIVKNGNDWTFVYGDYTVEMMFKISYNDARITVKDSDDNLTAIVWVKIPDGKELVAYCEENNIDHKVIY